MIDLQQLNNDYSYSHDAFVIIENKLYFLGCEIEIKGKPIRDIRKEAKKILRDIIQETDISEITDIIGDYDLLTEIGEDECKSHFDLISEDEREEENENIGINDLFIKEHLQAVSEQYTLQEIEALIPLKYIVV